jgi:hypothetical protein
VESERAPRWSIGLINGPAPLPHLHPGAISLQGVRTISLQGVNGVGRYQKIWKQIGGLSPVRSDFCF